MPGHDLSQWERERDEREEEMYPTLASFKRIDALIAEEDIQPVNTSSEWTVQQKAMRLDPGVYAIECEAILSTEQKHQMMKVLNRFKEKGIEFIVLERGLRIVKEKE